MTKVSNPQRGRPVNTGRLRPQAVSRVLAQAGFERSETESTAVRGWRRYTPGFAVKGARAAYEEGLTGDRDADAVFVTICTTDSYSTNPDKPTRRQVVADLVPRYTEALRAAGFKVSTVGNDTTPLALRVTRR